MNNVSDPFCSSERPAKLRISGRADDQNGYSTGYYYQIQNAKGEDLTRDGYYSHESVVVLYESGDKIGHLAQGEDVYAPNGQIYDMVGITSGSGGFIPGDVNNTTISQQRFSIGYRGKYYPLSTVLLHMTVIKNGRLKIAESKIIIP